jgi:hypothetical protein
LAFDKKEWKVNEVLDNDLFTISPSVDGKVIAFEQYDCFIPVESGTEYQVTLHLDQLNPKVAEKIKHFPISTLR